MTAPHTFHMRGSAVTFRASRFTPSGPVRVEVVGLDDSSIDQAAARLSRFLAEAGHEVRHLDPAPQCRRFDVLDTDPGHVRRHFAPVARSFEGDAP